MLRITPKVGSVAVRKSALETIVERGCGSRLRIMRLSPTIVEHNRFIAGRGRSFRWQILLRAALAAAMLHPHVQYIDLSGDYLASEPAMQRPSGSGRCGF
jgi:hypothetical protein